MEIIRWITMQIKGIDIKYILLYLLIVNIIEILLMAYDKHEAKTASWRVSEKTLFYGALLGGSIGGNLGMKLFRHKTQKPTFKYGFPIILIMQIVLAIVIIMFK